MVEICFVLDTGAAIRDVHALCRSCTHYLETMFIRTVPLPHAHDECAKPDAVCFRLSSRSARAPEMLTDSFGKIRSCYFTPHSVAGWYMTVGARSFALRTRGADFVRCRP